MKPPEDRLQRLETLKTLLAGRDSATAGELAAELGVTLRTVQRDLAALRRAGLPIEGERGRGGGLRLEQGGSLGRVHLNETEALSLLLSLTIADKIGSPLLLDDLRSVERKVNAAFSPEQARRIRALRSRVLVGQQASTDSLASYQPPEVAITQAVFGAFMRQRLAHIHYVDAKGALTERAIEVQYIYYNLPLWHALAWDHLRDAVRFFRLDRIRHMRLSHEEFRLRPARYFLDAGEPDARTM
jgi:predicted DNA-binding transcriptional regulator YafY